MNLNLSEVVICYATRSHRELAELLNSKSKDTLISIVTDLLTAYINDKNSSSLREFITVTIAGYSHNPNKLGYNGFKQITAIGGTPIHCEAKPKNIQTDGYDDKKTKPKLNGEGGFNDYTIERLRSDASANLNLLCSGFIDGELQYILEFPFMAVYERLRSQLPVERKVGTYTRTASFSFNHYSNCKELRIIYLSKESVIRNQRYFNKKLFRFLINYEQLPQ